MKKIGIYGSRSPERKKRSELVAKTVAKSLRRLGEYKDEPDEEQIRKARKTFFHINKTYNKLQGDTLRESKANEHIPHQDPKVAREHMVKFYNKTRKVPKKTNKYYEYVMKASHAFNLLDARGAISVTERQRFILRVRALARAVAQSYFDSRAQLGFPLAIDSDRQRVLDKVS